MSPTIHTRRQRGFTLVELLAALAIIGVLVGLVIMIMGSARERADKTKSAGNLRAIGVAMQTFASDHRGYPPPAKGCLSGETKAVQVWWALFLLPYVNGNASVFERPRLEGTWEDLNSVHPGTGQKVRIGYWMNAGADGTIPFPHGSLWRDRIIELGTNAYPLIRFNNPSRLVAIIDGIGGSSESGWNPGTNGAWKSGENNKYYQWADGSFNVLWVDGHVSAEIPSSLDTQNFVID